MTNNEIVPVALDVGDDGPIAEFYAIVQRVFDGDIPDGEAARKCINDVSRLKSALEAMGVLEEHIREYCLLDCKMWLVFSTLDDSDLRRHLTKGQIEKVKWLRSKTQDEVSDIIEECANGTMLSRIKARDTRIANKARVEDEYNRINDEFLKEMEETNRTQVNTARYLRMWSIPVKPDMRQVASNVNHCRNLLINRDGVHGLGDDEGSYANTNELTRDEVAQIVSNKMRHIRDCAKELVGFCKEKGFGIPSSGALQICRLIESVMVP